MSEENGKELVVRENFSLQPRNFEEAMKLADIMAKSDLVPKDYKGKAGNVLIAVQMGSEIGLKAMASIQNIAVINGRPCLWGDAALAVVLNHRDCVYVSEEDESVIGKTGKATCRVKRKGHPEVVSTFSTEDAKKAGLLGKQGPWSQYPNRMLKMRARGFAIRDSFPDALKGLSFGEEVRDFIDVEPSNIRTVTAEPEKENKDQSGNDLETRQKIQTEKEKEELSRNTPPENSNGNRVITSQQATEFRKECSRLKIPPKVAKAMLKSHEINTVDEIPADRYDELFKSLDFMAAEMAGA